MTVSIAFSHEKPWNFDIKCSYLIICSSNRVFHVDVVYISIRLGSVLHPDCIWNRSPNLKKHMLRDFLPSACIISIHPFICEMQGTSKGYICFPLLFIIPTNILIYWSRRDWQSTFLSTSSCLHDIFTAINFVFTV